MADLENIFARQSRYQDALVNAFEEHLRAVVLKAQAQVVWKLQRALDLDADGVIKDSLKNRNTLKKIGQLFMAEMKTAGYDRLVNAFVAEFDGTLPFLDEVINKLGTQVQKKWKLSFSKSDLSILSNQQVNVATSLKETIDAAAGSALTRGLFSLGGLRFKSLVDVLAEQLNTGLSKAAGVAETGMSIFYATANDRVFQKIEQENESLVEEPKYIYAGPHDLLNRPFCDHLLSVAKSYTREQIGKMNNGQLPNVFITRGGWRCRHQWLLDVSALEVRAAEAA